MCGYTMHRFYILYTEQSIKIVHMLLPPIYYHRYLLARVQGEFGECRFTHLLNQRRDFNAMWLLLFYSCMQLLLIEAEISINFVAPVYWSDIRSLSTSYNELHIHDRSLNRLPFCPRPALLGNAKQSTNHKHKTLIKELPQVGSGRCS